MSVAEVPRSRRSRRRWIILGVVIVVIVLLVVLVAARINSRRAAADADPTSTVRSGTVVSSVTASGSLVDQYTYSVAPAVAPVLTERDGQSTSSSASSSETSSTGGSSTSSSGGSGSAGASAPGYQTTRLLVGVGDAVKAGETIADATNVALRSSDLQSAVSNANATLSAAYTALSYDESTYESLKTSSPAATTQELNSARKQISSDDAAITTARSGVSTMQNNLSAQSTDVKSPVAGYILSLPTAVGASASQVATIGAGAREISVMVSEYNIAKVAPNQKVTVTLGTAGDGFAGTVSKISPLSVDSTGVEEYQVVIDSTAIPTTSRVGMTVAVSIAIAAHKNVLSVPATAIATVDGHSTVVVVDKNGRQSTIRVTLGLVGDTNVEILSGLTAGQKVITGSAGTVPAATSGPGRLL